VNFGNDPQVQTRLLSIHEQLQRFRPHTTDALPPSRITDVIATGYLDAVLHGGWELRALCETSLASACASTFVMMQAHVDALRLIRAAPTAPMAVLVAGDLQLQPAGGHWTLDGTALCAVPAAATELVALVTTNTGHMLVRCPVTHGGIRTEPVRTLGVRASEQHRVSFGGVHADNSSIVEVTPADLAAWQQQAHVSWSNHALGIAEAAYDAARAYVSRQPKQGKPLARQQSVHFKIAEMKVDIDGARLLNLRAGWSCAQPKSDPSLIASARLHANEVALRTTEVALQLCGVDAQTDELPLERLFRDARFAATGAGSPDAQREAIARVVVDGAA
jgi:alkylation response protein AidB-like acyl-CoA dehydrogenase